MSLKVCKLQQNATWEKLVGPENDNVGQKISFPSSPQTPH